MTTLEDALRRTETITFDCYGTLIDWAAGLKAAFEEIFGAGVAARIPSLFDAYVDIEAEVESRPYRPYRAVLAEVVQEVARRFDLSLAPGRAEILTERLPGWKPFPDTNAALTRLKQRYRLGVLSNIDRDLFAATAKHFTVEFDFVITAQDVRSYKPFTMHFRRAIADRGPQESLLHVAQSLYHDGVPAAELDIAFVWINRYNHPNATNVKPVAAFADLQSFAEMACG